MMKIVTNSIEMKKLRRSFLNQSVGFVPTMGALHHGHLSLLKRARIENDFLIMSIFVNPTQFNDPKDFEKYPSTWELDLEKAEQVGVDIVFAPKYEDLYLDGYKYKMIEIHLSQLFCGSSRAGHFEGVLTVVNKLFNIVCPDKVYFGEKDFQQMLLIKGMIEAFFMDIELISVPTVRESDGLAMSSRNVRLTVEQRKIAPYLYSIISKARSEQEAIDQLKESGFIVDYVCDYLNRRFAAVILGQVRLIDNVPL